MKNEIKKLNENPYWMFILSIYASVELLDTIIKTFKIEKMASISELPIFSFESFGNLLQIVTVFILYKLYKNYVIGFRKMKNEMIANNVISNLRNKYHFLQTYKDWDYYRLENETDEEFFNRLPEGKYLTHLKNEYKTAKNILTQKLDEKPSYIQNILDSIYGIKRNKK